MQNHEKKLPFLPFLVASCLLSSMCWPHCLQPSRSGAGQPRGAWGSPLAMARQERCSRDGRGRRHLSARAIAHTALCSCTRERWAAGRAESRFGSRWWLWGQGDSSAMWAAALGICTDHRAQTVRRARWLPAVPTVPAWLLHICPDVPLPPTPRLLSRNSSARYRVCTSAGLKPSFPSHEL